MVVKREKQPIITRQSLVNADMVLYQLSSAYTPNSWGGWFPKLYIYAEGWRSYRQPIWDKMVSRKHCQKLFPLFGVTKFDQLKEMVIRSEPEPSMPVSYPMAFDSAASILQSINLDDIGTKP